MNFINKLLKYNRPEINNKMTKQDNIDGKSKRETSVVQFDIWCLEKEGCFQVLKLSLKYFLRDKNNTVF